jgi:uncharacterized RDD family membrane protein YckC
MSANQENPYAAPQARVQDHQQEKIQVEHASRLRRLAAAFIDGILYMLCIIPMVVGMVMSPNFSSESMESGDWILELMDGFVGSPYFVATLITIGSSVGLFLLNIFFLAKYSASPGKKILGIFMVRPDGSKAGLGRLFGLRLLVNGILINIPVFGTIYWLVDYLFIFAPARRCLHDYLADTIVVKA